jgi:hypothetical protein
MSEPLEGRSYPRVLGRYGLAPDQVPAWRMMKRRLGGRAKEAAELVKAGWRPLVVPGVSPVTRAAMERHGLTTIEEMQALRALRAKVGTDEAVAIIKRSRRTSA